MSQQDQGVEPQIGHFIDQVARFSVLGRHDGLRRFFGHFFADCVRAFRVKACHIGRAGRRAFAFSQRVSQALQYIQLAHLYISAGSLMTGSTGSQRFPSRNWLKKQERRPV